MAAATGTLDLGFDASGWVWLGCAALVSTVAAVVLFFSGMSRVGPSTAAILSTLEPPVTVALVFVTFGEALGAVQLLGALAVLGAAVIVNLFARIGTVCTSFVAFASCSVAGGGPRLGGCPRKPQPHQSLRGHPSSRVADLGLSSGAISTRVKRGTLHRVHRGVYSLVPREALSRESRWLAALMAVGEDSALARLVGGRALACVALAAPVIEVSSRATAARWRA